MNCSDVAYIYSLPWGVPREDATLNKYFGAEIVSLRSQLLSPDTIILQLRAALKFTTELNGQLANQNATLRERLEKCPAEVDANPALLRRLSRVEEKLLNLHRLCDFALLRASGIQPHQQNWHLLDEEDNY